MQHPCPHLLRALGLSVIEARKQLPLELGQEGEGLFGVLDAGLFAQLHLYHS